MLGKVKRLPPLPSSLLPTSVFGRIPNFLVRLLSFFAFTGCFWLVGNLLTLGSAWERLWPIEFRVRLTETAGQYLLQPWDTLDGAASLLIQSRPIATDHNEAGKSVADNYPLSAGGINVYYTNRHPIRRPFNEQLSGHTESKPVGVALGGGFTENTVQELSEFLYPIYVREPGSIRIRYSVAGEDFDDAMLTIYRSTDNNVDAVRQQAPFYRRRIRMDQNATGETELPSLPLGIYGVRFSRMAFGKSRVNWTIDWTTDKWFLAGGDDAVGATGTGSRIVRGEGLISRKSAADGIMQTGGGDENSPLDICRSDGGVESAACVWTRWQSRYLLLEAWQSADVLITGRYAYPKQLSYDLPQIWLTLISIVAGYYFTTYRK